MLHFVDTSGDLVDELRRVFAGVEEVVCSDEDILAVARNAIVSAANSYGFMDGGIDAAYSAFFGPRVQIVVACGPLRRAWQSQAMKSTADHGRRPTRC